MKETPTTRPVPFALPLLLILSLSAPSMGREGTPFTNGEPLYQEGGEGEGEGNLEEEGPSPASEDKGEPLITEPESDIDAKYSERLRTIEEQVNRLKEQVFRSKARLLLLKETVLHGVISGARATIHFTNDMGKSYRLNSLNIYLDGTLIFSQEDPSGDLGRKEEMKIYEGSISPGSHTIIVHSILRGYGYGVFSYLNGYKFNVKSSYAFVAEEGKITRLKVISYEKGGLFTEFQDRPDVKYELSYKKNVPELEKSGEK